MEPMPIMNSSHAVPLSRGRTRVAGLAHEVPSTAAKNNLGILLLSVTVNLMCVTLGQDRLFRDATFP